MNIHVAQACLALLQSVLPPARVGGCSWIMLFLKPEVSHFPRSLALLQSKYKFIGYSKLLALFCCFDLMFQRVEKENLCSASSPWRGHTELASAKPVSRVPAVQGNEIDSGCLLSAHIWQSLILMPGPDLQCFLLNHPESAQRLLHGHQIWLGHGWNDNFDIPMILQSPLSPNKWSKIPF